MTSGKTNSLDIEYLDSDESLESYLAAIPPRVPCALDLEADSLHAYREKLCLIQLSCQNREVIIDPLAIGNFDPLLDFLCRRVVWFHSMDFDLTILKRTFDFIPPRVYDTQIAARLLGHRRYSLSHLLKIFFHLQLPKSSQKANWAQRPLKSKMLRYAVNDVRYVIPLAEIFLKKLETMGRMHWFVQTCQGLSRSVWERPPKSHDEKWRIRGFGRLNGRALAILKALWHWRDEEAAQRDRPPFRVLSNDDLLHMAQSLAKEEKATLPSRMKESMAKRLEKAIADSLKIPPSEYPMKHRRTVTDLTERSGLLFPLFKQRRDRAARRLEIDPSVIASRTTLEKISRYPESAAEHLLPWQRQLLDVNAYLRVNELAEE